MKIKDHAVDTARAVAFLSRIPLPQSLFKGYDGRLGRLVRAFPFAGIVIGFVPALALLLLLGLRADPLMAALIALSVRSSSPGRCTRTAWPIRPMALAAARAASRASSS